MLEVAAGAPEPPPGTALHQPIACTER